MTSCVFSGKYSLQLCIKYKKYYKGLFLGLVDLSIINDKGVEVLEARLGLSGGSSALGAKTGVKTT
ncbi:hypothetical protein V7S43_009454 [Phytophthora oleae]|uniref:Uncharacterized protein n=1 Tax=Phytophthora oleae TaxID=2107226 RepID=A0ABD3FEN8_9STRA